MILISDRKSLLATNCAIFDPVTNRTIMKYLIAFAIVCTSFFASGQADSLVNRQDSIFLTSGDTVFATITEISEISIKYTYPNESLTNSITINRVSKIHYKSGRVQEFSSSNLSIVKSCLDWESVQITNIESEVVGIQKIQMIGAKAKGMTSMSSTVKLQDRAYDKMRIEAAMLGGNIVYILKEHIEEAMSAGYYGSSKLPSVTISGIAYTTRKVQKEDISLGEYEVSKIYYLKANSFTLNELPYRQQSIEIHDSKISEDNESYGIRLSLNALKKVQDYQIIYADLHSLVLSGVYATRNGKKTYYNVFLIR
jgi:hypothetical protein